MNFYKSFGFVRKYSELWVHARYLTWLCFQFLRTDKGRTCERRSRNHENIHLPSWKNRTTVIPETSYLLLDSKLSKASALILFITFILPGSPTETTNCFTRETPLCRKKEDNRKKNQKKKTPNVTIPSTIDVDNAACVALCDYPLMPIIMQGNYSIHYEPISTQLAGPCPDFFSPHHNKAEWIPRTQSASQA